MLNSKGTQRQPVDCGISPMTGYCGFDGEAV